MAPSDEKLHEFYTLLNALSEQELAPAQLARLEELILGDSELRRRYLIYTQWHSALERYGLPRTHDPLPDEEEPSRGQTHSAAPAARAARPAPLDRQDRGWLPLPDSPWLLGGMLLLVVGLATLWIGRARLDLPQAGRLVRERGPALAPSEVTLASTVATLVDSSDCEWTQAPKQPPETARLASGWMTLSSGLAAIRFDCGTTVLLQGPAEFALNSTECGTLRSGRLVSKADSALATASGFKILTGNTEIVDQGTEFGVFADAGGSTEVHVFDGVARVRQRGVLHGAIPERELKAGQATRFEAPPAASPDKPVNRLDGPVGIAFGPDGNLYVASRFTDSILRYDGHTGALLDTFVPPRSGELNNPFFLTFGPDGQLYVSSTGNHAVLRFDGRTGEFRDAFVPPRAGDVAGPMGLAFGRDGNLYVASSGKQTVCRFDGRTGTYLGKVFASRSGDLDGPTGIAFGPDGDLWVADRNRDCILRFATQTGEFLARHTLDDRLKFPFDVAFQPSGQLYVASHANHQILKFDPATNRTLAGIDESQAPSWPQALTFGPDGRLYCTSDSANAVMRYDAASGAFVDAFVVSWQDLEANRKSFVMEMPNRVVCNTGVSRAGRPMRPGEHCPRWFIEKSPDPRFIPPGPAVVTSALADWRPNSDRSSWLSIAPVREDFRAAAGEYIFYAGFEVKPHEVGQARLVGQAWTPQQIVEVQVNKQPVPVTIESRPEGQATEFVIDQGFVVGLNFVYFIVTNPSEGPVAFRAELDYVRNREEGAINHPGTKGTKKDG